MSINMQNLDRRLRVFLVAPAAIVIGVLIGPGSPGAIVLYALAVVMLGTGAAGYCPLYSLIRLGGRRRALPH
jgi:Inner membrane protein YgaP-like, transmembrane domain